MVKPDLQRLLTTDSSQGRNIDNNDEAVKRSRRADFRAMPAKGPFYLVRHVSCNTSQSIIDRLGELMEARGYSYVSSEISGSPSHSPGSLQHKFDSICVLHGEDKCRAICFRATIHELQVLRFYRLRRLSAYNDFLDDLEFQWAGANPVYGIVWGNPANPVPDNILL